jgi:GTP-binding protein
MKELEGISCEPIEVLNVQVPEAFSGKVIDIVTGRKGDLLSIDTKHDLIVLSFNIPARSLIGLRNQMLTATEGEAIIAHRFKGYEPYKGDLVNRRNGALLSLETGTAIPYAINKLQDRGFYFVDPGEDVYAGQVIGEHIRKDDLVINVCKTKQLTNIRASGSDEKLAISPAIKFSLEEAMEYIRQDEYLEVTPLSIRLRKIYLDENERKRRSKA